MQKYHTDFDGNLITDENGEFIPSYVCICFAHSDSECVCGAWDISIEDWQEAFITDEEGV